MSISLNQNPVGGGGTDLKRGYGDVRPWRPPFHASPAALKGPISSKIVRSQDPLLRKFGNFSLYSLNFHPNFSSQAPKFGNFQLTSPQIWKFSAHEPPNFEIFCSQAPLFRGKCQFASPTLRKSGPHTPTWKKVECPPPPRDRNSKMYIFRLFRTVHVQMYADIRCFLTFNVYPGTCTQAFIPPNFERDFSLLK